jgi:opacity protein-like surface antigen
MKTRLYLVAAVLPLLLSTSVVVAQGAWSSQPPPSSTYTSRPVEQYPAPSSETQPATQRGYQGSFSLGVPVFLKADKNVVRPGADLNAFGGYEIGYVAFGLGVGAMWTPINYYNIPGAPPNSGYGRSPQTRLYLAPELRVQVPNNSPILPYIGITFDANWWRTRSTDIVCGWYYCTAVSVFLFSPGMTAKFGVAFSVSPGTAIDIGVKYSLSGPGSFFLGRQQWITPYIGMLFR